MQNIELFITGDGSNSIFVPELNENYHSKFGAITESVHIFINAGLKSISEKDINILEIGFGTGLNALLTFYEAELDRKNIFYSTIELYPLEDDIVKLLNYSKLIQPELSNDVFLKIHKAKWNSIEKISDFFMFEKIKIDLVDFFPVEKKYHLIYFDAFAPDIQPELWTEKIFSQLALGLKRGGILVTYSTKGDVKRALKNAGFILEKLPGPLGKREILRAKLV